MSKQDDKRRESSADSELREKLAAIEHERWVDWQKWCHEVLRDNLGYSNGGLEAVLERWDKQIATPYDKLSDSEKASDMEQVDRYWPLIEQYLAQEANKASSELEEQYSDIFKWLLGENGDFPQPESGKRYNFRTELRARLAQLTAKKGSE